MALITYQDKVQTRLIDVSDERKFTADNLNEIKNVVNANQTALPDVISEAISAAIDDLPGAGDVTEVANNLAEHEALTNNPHNVTKDQVGLSNVDNTPDTGKPVSTAQQTAIDAKVADAINNGTTTIAPSQNAVFDALSLKANSADIPLLTSFVDGEDLSGTKNESNLIYTIANTPVTGSVSVFWNGMKMKAGVGYTISGTTITMSNPPAALDTLEANYRK